MSEQRMPATLTIHPLAMLEVMAGFVLKIIAHFESRAVGPVVFLWSAKLIAHYIHCRVTKTAQLCFDIPVRGGVRRNTLVLDLQVTT